MNKVSGFCVTKFLIQTLKENVGYSVLKIHEDMFSRVNDKISILVISNFKVFLYYS